jgi:hypothetical protein
MQTWAGSWRAHDFYATSKTVRWPSLPRSLRAPRAARHSRCACRRWLKRVARIGNTVSHGMERLPPLATLLRPCILRRLTHGTASSRAHDVTAPQKPKAFGTDAWRTRPNTNAGRWDRGGAMATRSAPPRFLHAFALPACSTASLADERAQASGVRSTQSPTVLFARTLTSWLERV